MINKSTRRMFSGPGRRYWGRWGTSCLRCWGGYKLIVLDTEEMEAFFRKAKNCTLCAGTQRDAVPWSELFIEGRGYMK